jgi:hypothetical protein
MNATMPERLAYLAHHLNRSDPRIVEDFKDFFRDNREESRDRMEDAITDEAFREAQADARAWKRLLGMFDEADRIMDRARQQQGQDARQDKPGTARTPARPVI